MSQEILESATSIEPLSEASADKVTPHLADSSIFCPWFTDREAQSAQ